MLLRNDLWLGAAVLGKTEIIFQYLDLIEKQVVYTEDCIYRIMAADGLNLGHFRRAALLYECNSGVTARGKSNNAWHRKLMKDWNTVSDIIINGHLKDPKLRRRAAFVWKWKMQTTVRQSNIKQMKISRIVKEFMPLYLRMPGMFLWHFRFMCFPAYTAARCDMRVINDIIRIR